MEGPPSRPQLARVPGHRPLQDAAPAADPDPIRLQDLQNPWLLHPQGQVHPGDRQREARPDHRVVPPLERHSPLPQGPDQHPLRCRPLQDRPRPALDGEAPYRDHLQRLCVGSPCVLFVWRDGNADWCFADVRLLKYGQSLFQCKQLKRAALGRMATLIKRLKDPLVYLDQVRQREWRKVRTRSAPRNTDTAQILAVSPRSTPTPEPFSSLDSPTSESLLSCAPSPEPMLTCTLRRPRDPQLHD